MPSLAMLPASQIFGNSQRASARPARPTPMRNQTEGPNSPRSRGAEGGGTGRSVDSTSGADRPSRHSRTKAAARLRHRTAPEGRGDADIVADRAWSASDAPESAGHPWPARHRRRGCAPFGHDLRALTTAAGPSCTLPASRSAPKRPFSRAPGPARPVQQGFRIRRQVGVDHQFQPRQVDAPRRHVGRDTHPGPPVPQRLQRVGAFLLRQAHPTAPRPGSPGCPSGPSRWFTFTRVLQNTMAVRAS
jgi:hypothetical protein